MFDNLQQGRACVRYFRSPCDRDPPTGNFKNFKLFKNSLKYLTFTFGERTFNFGEKYYFWGNNVYFGGWPGFFGFFGISVRLPEGFGTPWVGGPRRGIRKHLKHVGRKAWGWIGKF